MNMLMFHQGEGPAVPQLHDPMQDAMQPRKSIVQEKGTRDNRREIQDKMRQHDHICWDTYNAFSPVEIRLQQIALKRRGQLRPQDRSVPELEDSGIKVGM